jgi:LysR family transcriptional regulator, regulator of abg operon
MHLNHVRAFLAVVETGSMSAAARLLGVSQPNVTKSIRALESVYHVQLVQRTTRGIVPTRYGQSLFAHAKVAHSELVKAEHELSELAGHAAGAVALGCGPVVADLIVPAAIASFREHYPESDIRIVEGFSHTLLPLVRDETIDFAVAVKLSDFRNDGGIRFRPLFVHERVVAARKGHPLARARSLAGLARASWLSFEPRGLLERDFAAHGLAKPKPVIQCESHSGFLSMLEASDMLGIVPRSVLTKRRVGEALRALDLAEKLPTLTVGIFLRADAPLTPAATALARAMTAAARKLARQR